MANTKRSNTALERDAFINNSSSAALHTSSQLRTSSPKYNSDDVIVSLANAYENRRAQQVSEWERAQTYRVHAA